MSFADRQAVLQAVKEAMTYGCSQQQACGALGVTERTVQRWRKSPEDQRRGPASSPRNKLTEDERRRITSIATSVEFCDKSPHQIIPTLADRGDYVASESSFYRVLKREGLLAHRGRAKPRTAQKPRALTATGPNQVYSWDITYLRASVKGMYFYLYLFLDVFSRKVVGWEAHERECAEHSANLLTKICQTERIGCSQVTVHSDNGSPMKGATMLVTMQKLGVMPLFSRPSVSSDNPFSEAMFRTLKYCPRYPSKPFANIEATRAWVAKFVAWYNEEHLHSGIKFVTPASRHRRQDEGILQRRKDVYNVARRRHPSRWPGQMRNWEPIRVVRLNHLRNDVAPTTNVA
jgi:putative transposase